MIEYRLFTRPELLKWRADREPGRLDDNDEAGNDQGLSAPRIGVQAEPSRELSLQYNHEVDDDAICAICAFDGERLVGRISILHFGLIVNDRCLRCCVGSNFMVLKDYRNSAVGLSILLKAMNLGMPYIEASVSGQMRGILEKMKQFYHVDSSPIFQVGLDSSGIVQIATWDFYKNPNNANILSEQVNKLRAIAGNWFNSRKVSRFRSIGYEVIKPEDAIRILAEEYPAARFPVQLPWNRKLLERGLSGKSQDYGAWLLRIPDDSERYRLVSLYRRDRVLGQDKKGNPRILREAHLSEIYPPVRADDPVRALLEFASHKAREAGASLLHIHALSPGLESVCRNLGLNSHNSKAVFVSLQSIDPDIKATLADPDKWWCRAFNEDQFEESIVSAKATDSLLS